MNRRILPPTGLEHAVILLTSLCVVLGLTASFADMHWFESVYVVEDGFIESMTVVALLSISVLMLYRFTNLYQDTGKLFKSTLIGMVLLGIFGAGEEMSWGQRIFNVQSTDFFLQYNSQQETNVHNMVVDGKKLNKIIFSYLLAAMILFYLLVFPFLHNRSAAFKLFADVRAGIPIPRPYHVAFILFLILLTWISPSHKRDELLEFGASFSFFMIFYNPKNRYIYAKPKAFKREPVLM